MNRNLQALAVAALGAAIMYAESRISPAPGLGFGLGMVCMLGSAFLIRDRGNG